jgi:hypothetical protein
VLHQALRKILSVLEDLKVPCALIGGLALAFYEIVRATEDLDILILSSPAEMATLAEQITAKGLPASARKDAASHMRLGEELKRCLNFMARK